MAQLVKDNKKLTETNAQLSANNEKLKDQENFLPIKLHIADSEGSKTVGRRRVREMIENRNVSILIGGLFSDEAFAEYGKREKALDEDPNSKFKPFAHPVTLFKKP